MKRILLILIPVYIFINSLGIAAKASGSDEVFKLKHNGKNNYIEVEIEPGDCGTIDFEISNLSGDTNTNHILVYDSRTAVNGGNVVMTPWNYTCEDTAEWFDENHIQVVLESGQSETYSIGYSVPEGIVDGVYTAILALYACSADTALDGSDVTIKIDSNYTSTIAILLRCGTESDAGFVLGDDMDFVSNGSGSGSYIIIPIDNRGDAYGFPVIDYSISDSEGQNLQTGSMKLDIFYRNTSSYAAIPVEDGILTTGSYDINIDVRDSKYEELQDNALYTFKMDDRTIREVIRNSIGKNNENEMESTWKKDFVVLGKQELIIGSTGILGAACISVVLFIIMKGRGKN